jgi:hypothetical protein
MTSSFSSSMGLTKKTEQKDFDNPLYNLFVKGIVELKHSFSYTLYFSSLFITL